MIEICKIFEIHEINNYIKCNKFYFLKKKYCVDLDKHLSENLEIIGYCYI